jgi:hypothetical protein
VTDRLGLLLTAAERLTVDLIAQEPITIRPSTDTPGYASFVATRENFDVLPVLEDDGRIVRYLRREALESHRSEVDWAEFPFDQIHPDQIISAVTPLLELLERFSGRVPRLFVLGRQRIDGIVTVYDLNQPAAHQFGFALSLVVEAELGRAIADAARLADEELDTEVDEHLRRHIAGLSGDKFKKARAAARKWRKELQRGEQGRLTHELTFHDKLLLVETLDLAAALAQRCRPPYGEDGDTLLFYLRKHVKSLRNAVAHDSRALADEWSVWEWMRTAYQLAHDLAAGE